MKQSKSDIRGIYANFGDGEVALKPPKRKRKVFKIALLVGLIAGLIYGGWVLFNLLKVTSNPFGLGGLKGESDGRVNILLLGIGDPGHAGEQLSDTTMVVSINTRTNQVAMISLPRDLRVRIPGHGYNKINQANADGGVDLAKQVVEETLDIPIHYYAVANFTGLKSAVDAVGGIDITNKTNLVDLEYPCEQNENRRCGFKLPPGAYHMNGSLALKYARCRKGTCGDDFGRAQRQQEVLQGIRQKSLTLSTLANPVKINRLIAAAGNNIKTDLSVSNIQRLNSISKKIPQNQIINYVFSIAPGGFLESASGSSDLVPIGGDFDAMQIFVRDIFTVGAIYTEKPTLAIENATTTVGLGAKFQNKITSDGYPITISSLATGKTQSATTQIIDFSGGTKPATVRYLEKLLGVKSAPAPTGTTAPIVKTDLKVILGSDYATKSQSTNSPLP